MKSKPFPLSLGGRGCPANIGEPISLYLESAFEQFSQLTSGHGDQRWEKERQQHGAEEHEISGRNEETIEETELVVLDPEHVRSPQILSFFFADLIFLFV